MTTQKTAEGEGQADQRQIDAFNQKADAIINDVNGDGIPDTLDQIIEGSKKVPDLEAQIATLEQELRNKDATIEALSTAAIGKMKAFQKQVQAFIEKIKNASSGT